MRSTTTLPDDGIVNRLPGLFIPNDGGFPLIGDTNSSYLGRVNTGFFQSFSQYTALGSPDFYCIVLNPAWLGIVLGKLLLCYANDVTIMVKDNCTTAGCTLV